MIAPEKALAKGPVTSILHIDASVRIERSLSRRLSRAFIDAWTARYHCDTVVYRDVGLKPPSLVDEAWIAACFTDIGARTAEMRAKLAPSDELIAELEAADILVIGTPMYNYGMPAHLKAWIDKVVRIGRTFSFDLARADWPRKPIFSGKTLVLLTSTAEFGLSPGGVREDMNHLHTHLSVVGSYLGLAETHSVGIEYQEFGDDRHVQSVASAHAAGPALIDRLAITLAAGRGTG